MKVIADVNANTKLVEITIEEIAQILGYNSVYEKGIDKDKCRVGCIVDIASFTKIASNIRNFDTHQLSHIIARLVDAQKEVETALALQQELKVFDILKDGS